MLLRNALAWSAIIFLCGDLTAADDKATQQLTALQKRLDLVEARFRAAPGYGLNTQMNRSGLLNAESVLLPPEEVAKIFGKDIASDLAVVRITLSNASRDAGFVLKAIAIDYARWPLSDCPFNEIANSPPFALASHETAPAAEDTKPPAADQTAAPLGSGQAEGKQPEGKRPDRAAPKPAELQLKDVDTYSYPCRVASMEVREVRQIAKLGQTNSWRNKTDRSLRGAGTVGGALTGVFRHGLVFPRILAAYNAGVVPVFEDIFKDAADDQINLLNDLAFRVNLLVPKESSITVTGFFPMKRFLSSELSELFRKEPALFFSPQQYLIRPDVNRKTKVNYDEFFKNVLERLTDESEDGLNICLDGEYDECVRQGKPNCKKRCQTCSSDTTTGATPGKKTRPSSCLKEEDRLNIAKNCRLRALLPKLSLNNVFVVASGEFVADVDTVAAQITGVTFDKPETDISAFGLAGTVTGTVTGTLLNGADPKVLNAADLGVSIKKVPDGSDDKNLKFELTLTKAIPTDKTIQFVAVKKSGTREASSNTFEKRVNYAPQKPVIDSTSLTGKPGDKIEVTGQNFYDTPQFPLAVRFTVDGKGEPALAAKEVTHKSATKIQVTIPEQVLAGKQRLQVRVGTTASENADIEISKK